MERSRVFAIVVGLVLSAGSWMPPAWAVDVRYAVTDLSVIWESSIAAPEKVTAWHAMAINDHGQIAGYAETTSNEPFAFVWDQVNGLRDLSGLGRGTWTYAINNLGQVPVGDSIWDPTSGFQKIMDKGSVSCLNDRGDAAGEYYPSAEGMPHAFVSRDGVIQDIGDLGTEGTVAYSINNLRQVVGWSGTPGWDHAFLWDAEDGMQDLGSFGKGSIATDINNIGQIVGYSAFEEGGCHACLWAGGEMTDIDPLGTRWSGATAVNDVGETVGNYGGIGAFVWNSQDGIAELSNLIANDSGWTIDEAYDINTGGQIVGLALKEIGAGYPAVRSVLLTPVPEPSLVRLLIGFAVMLSVRFLSMSLNRE
jgi:probable HAF family extracellular repeat protein